MHTAKKHTVNQQHFGFIDPGSSPGLIMEDAPTLLHGNRALLPLRALVSPRTKHLPGVTPAAMGIRATRGLKAYSCIPNAVDES